MTAGVQADLELEGFAGLAVATEDKALQFGRPFQRHSSEPESGRQYAVYKTVHTQGQWAYREDYQMQYDAVEVPRRDAWVERGSRSLPDSGRASPCHRDGEWFIKLLQAEVEKMEGWCQQMEREAEDYDLPEESEWGRVPRAAPRCSHLWSILVVPPSSGRARGWDQCRHLWGSRMVERGPHWVVGRGCPCPCRRSDCLLSARYRQSWRRSGALWAVLSSSCPRRCSSFTDSASRTW